MRLLYCHDQVIPTPKICPLYVFTSVPYQFCISRHFYYQRQGARSNLCIFHFSGFSRQCLGQVRYSESMYLLVYFLLKLPITVFAQKYLKGNKKKCLINLEPISSPAASPFSLGLLQWPLPGCGGKSSGERRECKESTMTSVLKSLQPASPNRIQNSITLLS